MITEQTTFAELALLLEQRGLRISHLSLDRSLGKWCASIGRSRNEQRTRTGATAHEAINNVLEALLEAQ